MAENKQPFDDFNADEFDAFDEEDFNFDDDDEASFQFDDEIDAQSESNQDESSEYEFSGDEVYTEAEEPTQAKTGPMAIVNNIIDRLKNEEPKQLIKYGIGAVVVLILVIGGLIKVIMPASTPVNTSHSKSPVTPHTNNLSQTGLSSMPQPVLSTSAPVSQSNMPVTMPINNPNEAQSINLTPASAVPVPSQSTSMVVAQMPADSMQQLQQVENQNSDLTKRVSDLESVVNQLNAQLAADAQMNASNQAQIAGLIKSIDSMQTQMAKLNNAMQTIISAVNQSSVGGQSGFVNMNNSSNNVMSSSPDYYVQAIIPGRAWLKNSGGQIITVAPGDGVPGYGTVTNIDPQNGIVTTSTGTKIVFGIDEG